MKLDIGTCANIVKHSDNLIDMLRGGNTSQMIGKLKALTTDATAAGKLLTALEGLEQNLRVLKLVEVNAGE
jgi:hypothetical protein